MTVKNKAKVEEIQTLTVTCAEATKRHCEGVEENYIARMCLKGKALAKRYGGASKVPESQKKAALFAKKVANRWFIPVSELNRVFLL